MCGKEDGDDDSDEDEDDDATAAQSTAEDMRNDDDKDDDEESDDDEDDDVTDGERGSSDVVGVCAEHCGMVQCEGGDGGSDVCGEEGVDGDDDSEKDEDDDATATQSIAEDTFTQQLQRLMQRQQGNKTTLEGAEQVDLDGTWQTLERNKVEVSYSPGPDSALTCSLAFRMASLDTEETRGRDMSRRKGSASRYSFVQASLDKDSYRAAPSHAFHVDGRCSCAPGTSRCVRERESGQGHRDGHRFGGSRHAVPSEGNRDSYARTDPLSSSQVSDHQQPSLQRGALPGLWSESPSDLPEQGQHRCHAPCGGADSVDDVPRGSATPADADYDSDTGQPSSLLGDKGEGQRQEREQRHGQGQEQGKRSSLEWCSCRGIDRVRDAPRDGADVAAHAKHDVNHAGSFVVVCCRRSSGHVRAELEPGGAHLAAPAMADGLARDVDCRSLGRDTLAAPVVGHDPANTCRDFGVGGLAGGRCRSRECRWVGMGRDERKLSEHAGDRVNDDVASWWSRRSASRGRRRVVVGTVGAAVQLPESLRTAVKSRFGQINDVCVVDMACRAAAIRKSLRFGDVYRETIASERIYERDGEWVVGEDNKLPGDKNTSYVALHMPGIDIRCGEEQNYADDKEVPVPRAVRESFSALVSCNAL